jgi:hypothetical protein
MKFLPKMTAPHPASPLESTLKPKKPADALQSIS